MFCVVIGVSIAWELSMLEQPAEESPGSLPGNPPQQPFTDFSLLYGVHVPENPG